MPTTTSTITVPSIEDFKWKPGHDQWLTKLEQSRAVLAELLDASEPFSDDAEYAERLSDLNDLAAIGDTLSFALTGMRDLCAADG